MREAFQRSRAAPRLKEKLRLLYDEVSHIVKTNKWLKYYTLLALIRIVNRIGARIFVDRQAARKIIWKDHVVVISGGARGIGGTVCQMLKAKGAKVVVIDRADGSLHHREDLYISADVTSEEEMLAARKKVHQEFGYATMIISAAGITRHGFVLDPPAILPSSFSTKVHDVNMTGTYVFVKVFGQDMLADYDDVTEAKLAEKGQVNKTTQMRVEGGVPKNGFGGHILLLGSGAAFIPLPGNSTYNSSKAGVVSFHQTLGWELDVWHKTKNVRNSVFCPLMIDTAMTQGRMKAQRSQFFLPTLTVDQAAGKIVKVLEQDRSQMFFAPRAAQPMSFLIQNLPTWVIRPVIKLLKTHETFVDYAAKTRHAVEEH
ncbi:hypothetical protein CBS101457_004769 [Exobasidium rhododendri]|nr:hypothetical protein CBS101457_004769 [Exobasidium rhododendri]